ncbi:D-alanyl-D-alanine carboxypeptidase [Halomonas sp. V046]|uniref:D-alanyl-D-alanine carboxypeptidase n=1 Tax=Halomonas sp. V046 TaxID=3459611 RepID=UPI004043E31C
MVSARSPRWRAVVALTLLLVSCLVVGLAQAAGNPRYAGIVVDAESHEILYAEHADEQRYPASLTKMMTLYLLFESLEGRTMSLGQPLAVSSHAASMPATKLWLKRGDTIPVEKAIQALVVRSANDVAVVVAESLGGSESHFASMMTRKARDLGMANTTFRNASGLPDAGQVTTARDMAVLARRLMLDFPQYYPYFALQEFTWRGTRHTGHNRLLKNYPGTDGLKTGFIRASGFNVATSATRNGRRMVAVVMGGYTAASRDEQMVSLLDRGFLRASLTDGRGFLANTDISGGELMAAPRGLMSAPSRGQQVAVASRPSSAVTPSRVETIVRPAAGVSSGVSVASSVPSYSYESNATRGSQVRFDSQAPVINPTHRREVQPAVASVPTPTARPSPAADPLRAMIEQPSSLAASAPAPAPASRPVAVASAAPVGSSGQASVASAGDPSPSSAVGAGEWGVQVGAFSDAGRARSQASQAADRLVGEMAHARVAVARAGNADVYRAQVVDLQEGQARQACQSLMRQGMDCMVVQASL